MERWMTGPCCCELYGVCDKLCYPCSKCCLYAYGNHKARKAFYYQCFPAEKTEEAEEKPCEECANCYTIVSSTSCLILEKLVNDYLQRGWVLQGGIVKDGVIYMQAMVKK